jgi:hypothetical protein
MKAFTRPSNVTSTAFHEALGFVVAEVPDYVGPGEARVVFRRALD